MIRIAVMLLAMCALGLANPAQARRAALIIGNSNYANANYLPNPDADARLVAQSAQKAGFDVTLVEDLGKNALDSALRTFRAQADGAEVALIYYAGHGIESAGKNWVVPTDAVLQESRDLRFEAIELDGLLETLIGAQLRIVVLDACRNNPFGSNWRSTVRSVPKGLAETEVEGALVIFAAAGGQVATDGTGTNSPFATALANRLPEPGLSIHRLGSVVREDVVRSTGGRQTPWTNMSIDGREFFLVGGPGARAADAGGQSAAGGQGLADAYAWKYADAQDSVSDYEDYLTRFPDGVFAKIAQQRIAAKRAGGIAPVSLAAPASTGSRPSSAPAPALRPVSPDPAPALVVKPVVPAAQSLPATGSGQAPASATDDRLALATAAANVVSDRAPLPTLPPTPRFSFDGYPNCREDFKAQVDPTQQVISINSCLTALTSYFDNSINAFSRTMIAHQQAISALYTDQVARSPMYAPESQQRFYRAMMAEHAASNPDGANFADWRAARETWERDRDYLQDRYCATTGTCGGYTAPAGK